eukprot:3082145-Amphidinium_carterae.1
MLGVRRTGVGGVSAGSALQCCGSNEGHTISMLSSKMTSIKIAEQYKDCMRKCRAESLWTHGGTRESANPWCITESKSRIFSLSL